jgi:4-hydroxy-3-methylbut-2-enyl diphosphate reductase
MILVIGAPNSSNSNRLREIAEELGVPSHLIENAGQLDPKWLEGVGSVGVTAGASAPDVLVQEVVAKLQQLNQVQLSFMEGIAENVKFRLPPQLEVKDRAPSAAK